MPRLDKALQSKLACRISTSCLFYCSTSLSPEARHSGIARPVPRMTGLKPRASQQLLPTHGKKTGRSQVMALISPGKRTSAKTLRSHFSPFYKGIFLVRFILTHLCGYVAAVTKVFEPEPQPSPTPSSGPSFTRGPATTQSFLPSLPPPPRASALTCKIV